jgi:hypothetical protein
MKVQGCLVLLTGCWFLCGCQREASIPGDSFRLGVQEVISGGGFEVSVLTVRALRDASISVDGEGFHTDVVLPSAPEGTGREGEVVMSAARVAPSQDKEAYVQILIRSKTTNAAAGGPSLRSVPVSTPLASCFSICVTNGIYKLNAPVTIARMQGKPVTLVVGKPTE